MTALKRLVARLRGGMCDGHVRIRVGATYVGHCRYPRGHEGACLAYLARRDGTIFAAEWSRR